VNNHGASTTGTSGQASAATFLCFDVGGTRIKGGLVRGAEVHGLTTAPTAAGDGAKNLVSTLVQVGLQVMPGEEISGIGL